MAKQMIVNATASEEIRVAIVENKKLVDLDYETSKRHKQKGNIYKGIVANVEDSLEAAFIEFGEGKQGFLALSEVRPSLFPEKHKGKSRRKVKISEIFERGQEIIVQVTKDEIGTKGAAVTTYLSLPGRYVVLMHSDDGGNGISRKIDDEDARRRARDLLSLLSVSEGMAVIIRTAGMNRPRQDLYRDLKALFRIWEKIDRGAALGRAPTLLHREPDLVLRTIRDYFSPEVNRIIIDSDDEFEETKGYFEERMPDSISLLEHHTGKQPIFEAYGIERAIEDLFQREVKLRSGGSIVIDQTEALVAVDVNSGKSTRENDHEATVYKTNLEAATEVARQLRLRDLGGIIVIDFIDMVSRKHERDVERAVRDAMRTDKAKVKIGRISENGTLEITRQRLRQAHRLISHAPCPHCEGTGIVRDPEGLAVMALRTIQGRLARTRKRLARLSAKVPLDVANVLNNQKRSELMTLSETHQLQVDIIAEPRLSGGEIKFDEETRGRAGLDAAHGIKDPRLDGDKRGRRGRRKDPMPTKTVPPPSIGAVPEWLLDEEKILRGDPAPGMESEVVQENYDDPLTDILFGGAPTLPLAEIEAAEEDRFFHPKKRKRRRRSRRRGRGDDVEGGDSSRGSDGDGPGDDNDMAARDADSEAAPKKKRRSRRKRSGPRDDTSRETGGAPHDAGTENGASAKSIEANGAPDEGPAATAEVADKPKKRTSRRKKAAPLAAEDGAAASTLATPVEPKKSAMEAPPEA